MSALSVELLFETAVIIYLEDESLSITIEKEGIKVKFPAIRRLAEYLHVPHYYILPYFEIMEEEKLVIRVERVGIMTTVDGTKKLFNIIKRDYTDLSHEKFGNALSEFIHIYQ